MTRTSMSIRTTLMPSKGPTPFLSSEEGLALIFSASSLSMSSACWPSFATETSSPCCLSCRLCAVHGDVSKGGTVYKSKDSLAHIMTF